MKYISLVVLLAAMAWTWSLAKSDRELGLQDHREMENQIEQIITDYVRQSRPTVTDLNFQQLFTEVVKPGHEILVHVRYTVVDSTQAGDKTQESFQGKVILKSGDGRTWSWAGQDVKSPLVEFESGLRVSTKQGEPEMDLQQHPAPGASESPQMEASPEAHKNGSGHAESHDGH